MALTQHEIETLGQKEEPGSSDARVFAASPRRVVDPWAGVEVLTGEDDPWAGVEVLTGADDPWASEVSHWDSGAVPFGADVEGKAPSAHERAPGERADPRNLLEQLEGYARGERDALPEMGLGGLASTALTGQDPARPMVMPEAERGGAFGRDAPTTRSVQAALQAYLRPQQVDRGIVQPSSTASDAAMLAAPATNSPEGAPIVGVDNRAMAALHGGVGPQMAGTAYRLARSAEDSLPGPAVDVLDWLRDERGIEGRMAGAQQAEHDAPGTYLAGGVASSYPLLALNPTTVPQMMGLGAAEGALFSGLREGAIGEGGEGETLPTNMGWEALLGGGLGAATMGVLGRGGRALRGLAGAAEEGGSLGALAGRLRAQAASRGGTPRMLKNIAGTEGTVAGNTRLEQFGRDVGEEGVNTGIDRADRQAAVDLRDRATTALDDIATRMTAVDAWTQGARGRVPMESVIQALEAEMAQLERNASGSAVSMRRALQTEIQRLEEAMDAAGTMDYVTANNTWRSLGRGITSTVTDQLIPESQSVVRAARAALRRAGTEAAETAQPGLGEELDRQMRLHNVGKQIQNAIDEQTRAGWIQRHGAEVGVGAAVAGGHFLLADPDALETTGWGLAAFVGARALRGRTHAGSATAIEAILPALRRGGGALSRAADVLTTAARSGPTVLAQLHGLLQYDSPEYRAELSRLADQDENEVFADPEDEEEDQ